MVSVLKRFSITKLLIALLLLLLAVAQGLYATRNFIASEFPKTRASLSLACDWLSAHQLPCTIALSHDIKKLSIEDTALLQSKTHADVIKLSGTLSNHANEVQAYPNLELNLKNAQNIVVLRRYLLPFEYSQTPEKGIAPRHSQNFSVSLMAEGLLDGVTVTGYQIKISY